MRFWHERFLALGLGSLIAVSLGELFFRMTDWGAPNTVYLFQDVVHKRRPSASFVNRAESPNKVEFNNLGFHDRNRAKTHEGRRILVLGDSFVEALQVPADSIFTALLEDRLRKKGCDIEVLNGGLTGTGTAHQYLLWRTFFEGQYGIDHVILTMFLGNDLSDNSRVLFNDEGYPYYVTPDGKIEEIRPPPSPFRAALQFLRSQSAFANTCYEQVFRRLRRVLRHVRSGGPSPKIGLSDPPQETSWHNSVVGTALLLKRWRKELAKQSIPFDIILIGGEVPDPGNYFNRVFKDTLDGFTLHEDIGVLDFGMNEPMPTSRFWTEGQAGHFNMEGHHLLADTLFQWLQLQRRGICP